MEVKEDEFQPFPAKDQLPGIEYCITSHPPWPESLLLGFQHYLVVLGTTVLIPTILVPQMGGGNEEKAKVVQTLLFVTGINTLLQVYFGTRLPAVISGSHTFLLPTLSIVFSSRYSHILDPRERFISTMRGIQGAVIVGSFLQIALGFMGFWRIAIRYLSPLSGVSIVTLSGLGLFYLGFPMVASCIEIGLPEILLLVFLSQIAPHVVKMNRLVLDRSALILSVVIIWIYAHILTAAGAYRNTPHVTQFSCRTDRSGLIDGTPWISIPYPFQWGRPTFNCGECFAMMAASFAALIESTGTLIAVQRFASATPVPPSIFSRGVGWQGIGILLAGMFGTTSGSSASVENAGLLGLTQIGSRRVITISACFMIFFSVLGKFGALFSSIPMPIFAALHCILFAYVASAGLSFLQFCNLNSFRTKFILGFSLFMGLSVAQYFKEYSSVHGRGPVHTRSQSFNDIVNVIFSSPATVAAMVGYFLDTILCHGDIVAIRRDRGCHWWEKFRSFRTDLRSEEFYSLPYSLNKLFPAY